MFNNINNLPPSFIQNPIAHRGFHDCNGSFEGGLGPENSRESIFHAVKNGLGVETRLLMPGSAPIKVGWQVSDASGTFKMIDVKIEGISLLTTERGEIRNQYTKGGKSILKLINSLTNY